MEEEDENKNMESDKSIPNAKEIYLLMKREYRISRNIRASWYFKHLNRVMSFVPPTSLSDLSQEELIVLSVIPEEDQVAFQPGQLYYFRLTTKTKVIFMSTQYRIAFALDLSPSLSSLDLCSGRVLWDDVFLALHNCLTGLLQPFCPPGLDLDLAPSLYVTVVAYTPLVACRNNFVLCQGVLVTLKNLRSVLCTLQTLLKNFEDNLAQHFHSLADIHMNSYDFDDLILSDGSDMDTMSRRSKSEDQKIEELIYKPEHGFVNVLRFGILALQLLPENATAGIAVVTDGMVGLPDANVFEALLSQLRNSSFACSFLHIGCSHHSNLSFGRVAHTELMKFVAAATFGGYFAAQPNVENTGRELNVYHKAFFLWSFQKGLTGFEVPDSSLHCKPNRMSTSSSWLDRLPTHPITNQEIPVIPIMRKKHKESNLHTTISEVLSLRLREGYTIRKVNLIKGESQLEVHLVLPWREYARIEYIASASWPLSTNKRHTHVEIFIEGNYEFLHEMTCTDKRPSKSPFRTAHVKKYWQSLQNLMQTDQLLVHLHSFSSNPVNYTVPRTLKNGLPLLPSEYSLQQDPSLSDLIKFWNPIASLDINIWQKWMHTHRIGIVLQHDIPLKKYLHTPNSNGYFHSVHCYKAMTALNTMLRQWCTFVLEENHSNLTYMYIKFDDSDPDKAPSTFYILRASSKPPCLVLRLAFLGGTAGDERHTIVSQLREEVLKLQLSQRGPQKNTGARASNEKRKPQPQQQQLSLPMSLESRMVNRKELRLGGTSNSGTLPKKPLSDIKCCVVLNKPVEKILIRYERVPQDLSIVEDPAREIPRRTSSHAEKASRSVAAMFNTMSRYLYHKRWIWSVQQGSWPTMSMSVVGRMLSTLAKIRIQEGFHFALTTVGIVNVVLELEMKSDNLFGAGSISYKPELKDKDVENNNLTDDLTSSTCVVQYILFPPSKKNTQGSVSEDDMEEAELPESDGELQIVTECWVEPQYGISVNNPIERRHFDGLAYKEIASAFYDIDYEAISCLTTFEQLIQLCQSRSRNHVHLVHGSHHPQQQSQQQQPHTQQQQHRQNLPSCLPGINKFSSPEKCLPDMDSCSHLNNNVTTIPFPYNLMGILPRCQQAEMLFSGYTVNRSTYTGDEWKTPNSVLIEIFLEKLKTSHGQEIWLSAEECKKFTELLFARKNEQVMSASSLITENRPENEETETSSKSLGVPLDTPQSENTLDDVLFSAETNQSVGRTKWRCFLQDINTSHMFLTFVPASFEDLRTLKPGIYTETLHDNLEIVEVNEWNPTMHKTKFPVYEEIITGPSPVDESSFSESVSSSSKNLGSIRTPDNSLVDSNLNCTSQPAVTSTPNPHSIPSSPGIGNSSPSFSRQNKPISPLQPILTSSPLQPILTSSPLQPALTPSTLQPTKLPPSSTTHPTLSPLQTGSSTPSLQPNSVTVPNGTLPSPGLQADVISPNCASTSAQSITETSSSNLPPEMENDNSLFQEKEYFIIPVYIYDCSLSKIIDSLVHKGAFTVPQDIVEDHTIGDNLLPEFDLGISRSQVANNLDIHDDSSEGGRQSTASLDRRSNDSISDHPGDFKKHREKVTDVFSSSYVIGIFRNLTDQHYVDKMDIDSALDICEESPPLEINILQFLHASCGHLRYICSKQKKHDEDCFASFFCTDSPRKSAVRFSDRNERFVDQPNLCSESEVAETKSFHLPSIKVPIPLSPMDEGRTCEYVSELHQIISHKFADTMSNWFKPVPSCPDHYFFCPDPVRMNNNVPGRTGDMSEEQVGTTNESVSRSGTNAEDTDIVVDSPGPEVDSMSKFPLLNSMDPSDSDSDDQSTSSSGIESSDSEDPYHPLFISFICTLKQNADHHNIVVGTIPTCLGEITNHLQDKLSELDLGNLQVTFDVYCLTLPLEMDPFPKKFPFIGFAEADDDSSLDGFQKRDPFSFLPKYQHEAIMDCKQEIEWFMRDEIVCALRYVYPIREDKLQMVTEHVQESVQLGKTNCYIEEVSPQFVFGSDQSLGRFLDELQRVNIKDYRFKKEGPYFYLVLTRAMAAHFLALSSAVCSLDDTNQTPEKTTRKPTPDDNKGKLSASQRVLSRCISESCQDWREGSVKSGLDGREPADVSIQLTNEKGLKEVCPLSPERVAMLNKMDPPCLLTDSDEGVLKRSSSFGGFDAEGCRKVQHQTVAISDKYLATMAPGTVPSTPAGSTAAAVSSGASCIMAVTKHLTSSPMAHLTCRARHSSAPTAAQKNMTGASSQPSTMPATPSWISSRGSFTEEAGYDGDSSDGDSNNDDGAFFNETGGQRSSMPNFWLVMRVEPKKVTLYYHVRGQKDLCINQRAKQLLKDVSDVIMDTCKKVNQLFLLQDLFTTRMCNVLLVPEADEDICWTKDRFTVPTDGEDEDDDDEQKTYRYLADTRSFLPGHFACKCIWEIHLALHPRLKNWERRSNVSTGMQALRSVLSKLSVLNRKNMFVMNDGIGNYFYVRLVECKLSNTNLSEDVTNGRQEFDCSYSDYATISPISTPKRDDDDEESSKSLRDADTLSISSIGSYVSKRSDDYIKVSMHGITPAGDEMTEDLRKMLQNKLDDKVLDIISVMLDRNPKCKLNFEDVRFIQRHKEAPKDTIYVTIPNSSLQQLFPLFYYLKQNILQFVHVPNYVDNHPTKHFIDYASSENQELKENQVFLYHRPSSSGGKGIACIAMAFVDSRDQEMKFIGCQKPPSLPYDELVPPDEYSTLIETRLLEDLPPHSSKPGLTRFIRFRIWERGNVDIPSLQKKLITSVKHALCDVVSEFQLLTIPICQVSHELLPCYSEPCSPSVVKVAENEEKLYVASRKLSIQMSKIPSKLSTVSKDKAKTPVVTPSPKDVPKFADSLWNISTPSIDGSTSGQQLKNRELRNMLLQYESGEKGFLHSVFWTSLPRWFDFCYSLGVPAVNKMELEVQARFSVDFLLRELPTQFANITRDINLKVFKLVREIPEGEILTGVPYSPLRNNSWHFSVLSKRGSMDTSFEVDWNNKVSPGKQQQFVVVGRNVEQWSSCVDHYDGRDCPDDSPSSHTSKVSHRELRFSPYLPSGSSTNLESSPTDKYHTLFVPRQHLLLLLINDKTITFYSYNVAGDMTTGFKKLLRNMVNWQNARAHVLDCLVAQKMGLYHHQPFGESLPIKQQNPFTQANMDVDLLVLKTYLPKDVSKRNNSMICGGSMPYCPQMMGIVRPFDETYRNLKPAQPLHQSPQNNKYDIVIRHGQQAQEIRNNYRKDMDKMLKLRELHSMWFSKNFASISEDIIQLLKQSSRLLHYCATPLLFSPAWRREVLKRVPSKKPEPTPSPVIQEKTDIKVRSRHSSGASIASLLSKRHDCSQEGKRKDRHSQDCTDSPQQRPSSLDSPQDEEDWHREIRKKFLQQYMQHLQSLGFVQIQTRPASPKRINGRPSLRKLASEGGRTVRDECEPGKKEVYDMQKTLSGGMILVELNFCDQHYYVKLYGYDCSRMGANVNSQLRLYFVDECDTYRALTHVHSFAHDFHLRCIMNHISNDGPDLFRKDYHVTSFLADFLEVYPIPPNFSRNFVFSDYLQLSKLTCPSGQLYDYILKHPDLHDFTVISLRTILTDSELDLESGSHQDKEEALVLHRQSRTSGGHYDNSSKPNDEYNVGVVVKLDARSPSGGSICSMGSGTGASSLLLPPSGKDNSTLCLQYFLVLTSKCELPMQSFVQKLGGTLRATGAFLVPNTVDDFEQFSVPVKQHIGVRSETTNKQRRLSPLHCFVTKEAEAAKRKIERTVMFCMGKCRRDILWERLLKGGQEEEGKKRRRNESADDGLPRLTFTDFEELLCMVESSSLSKLDERLLHFTNMGPHWFSTLLAYLPSRYGEQFRYFVNTDGKTQCAVIVNADYTDTCILLSVNSSTGRADLSLLNREARTATVVQTPAEDEQHQEAIQNLVETFIGACCFHLWSSMLG